MARRGPKKWRWFSEPLAAKCKGCNARWDSVFEVYNFDCCPECGFTPDDAREQERLQRAADRNASRGGPRDAR